MIKFFLLMVVAGLLTIGVVYFFAMNSTTVSVVNSRAVMHKTTDFILPILLQTIAVVLVAVGLATIWLTLVISHKLSGPLYRFKKAMLALGEGDLSTEFKIRNNDQLKELADGLNIMIKKLREEIGVLKNNFGLLKEKIDSVPDGQRSSSLDELKKISEDIQKIINYFKS